VEQPLARKNRKTPPARQYITGTADSARGPSRGVATCAYEFLDARQPGSVKGK